jgi:hypothetical protein
VLIVVEFLDLPSGMIINNKSAASKPLSEKKKKKDTNQ